jgi:hypothetical protein
MAEITRAEHLAWCKSRALQYVDAGNLPEAFASMASDISKHAETRGHGAMSIGMTLLLGGRLATAAQMRDFIEGFN